MNVDFFWFLFVFMSATLSVSSFNVNGLRAMDKLEKLLVTVKTDIVCLQETRWTDEIMNEIKKRWNGLIYVNNRNNKSCGVAILIKTNCVSKITEIKTNNVGRIIMIDFEYAEKTFRLINVYAPNIETERRGLFKWLQPFCKQNTIMVGDFNVWCSRLDACSVSSLKSDSTRTVLLNLMKEQNMIDVWRNENPNKREYSRRQVVLNSLRQSRIDLCIVKEDIVEYIKKCMYRFTALSDHAVLCFDLCVGVEGRGGGVWCFNSCLLEEKEYRDKIVTFLKSESVLDMLPEDTIQWWEMIKEKIKKISIRFAKQRKWEINRKERDLKDKLKAELEKIEYDPLYNIDEFVKISKDLNVMEMEKCRGAIIRSKAQFAMEGEKCTSFFLNLEKAKQKRGYIAELENERGETVTDLVGILEIAQNFYTNLFKKSVTDDKCVDTVIDSVSAEISEDDKNDCDSDIRIEEIKHAINSMQIRKSPGIDGLTSEFYKSFVDVLAPMLLKVFKCMEQLKEVPESMATGMITLIFKKKGSIKKLENYRPISLLNVDYKILAKVLSNRIKNVLGSVISPTQAYSVPGRDIADTVCTIQDVIRHMEEEGGIVLSLDLNKAFDRVEHDFLWKTMGKLGFGKRIIEWLKLLYVKAKSCVKCNGVLTDTFPLERSVRQGCPLSALLYTISAEPLAAYIKQDNKIQGIQLPGGAINVINQFADDTTITVQNEESVKRIMESFEIYGKASGAKINVEKSEIMYVGKINRGECDIPFTVANDFIRVLGIYVGSKEKEARDLTWTGVLNKIKQIFNCWKQRKLKLKGKVVVVNSLLLSKFVYVLNALDLPEWVIKEMNQAVTNFLWDGKAVRIAHNTLIGEYKDGGLKLIDLNVKKRAIRVKTVMKYLFDKIEYGWKCCFKYFLYKHGGCGENGLLMNLKEKLMERIPGFYREVLEAWGGVVNKLLYDCNTMDLVLSQPVMLNPKVSTDGKLLYHKDFYNAGLRQIKDFVYEVIPGFLPDQAIIDCVQDFDEEVCKSTIVNMYNKLKTAVPVEWKQWINSEEVGTGCTDLPALYIEKNGKKTSLKDCKVKDFYWMFVENELKRPTSETTWLRLFKDLEVCDIWISGFAKYNSRECEDIDFKIKHNRIFTNDVIHQINKNVRRECDVCENEAENLLHLFVNCEKLKDFFVKLKSCLEKNWGKEFIEKLDWKKMFLFGIRGKSKKVNINLFNFVLSHARYAIWLRRNLAHFEGKRISVWTYFESIVRKDVFLVWKYGKVDFERFFVQGSGLISVSVDEKLIFDF